MNFKRIGRLLVCLVLICALLFSISPLRVSAVVVPPSFQMLPEEIVIRAVAGGLGAAMEEDPEAFSGLCDFIRSVWDAAGYIVDGMVQVFRLPSTLGDGELNYIERALIELTRNSLINGGWIRLGLEFSTSHSFKHGTLSYEIVSDKPFALIAVTAPRTSAKYYVEYLAVAPYSFGVEINGGISQGADDYGYYYARGILSSSGYYPLPAFSMPCYEVASIDTDYGGVLLEELPAGTFLCDGLPYNFVGDPRLDFASAYPGWASVETLIDGVPMQLVGLGVGQTVEETLSMSQEQIWMGQILGELEDLQQGQVTQSFLQQLLLHPIQTLGLILEELISIPGKILGGLGQILTDVLTYLFVPAQDFLQLKLQALIQKFGYLEPIISLGDTFKVYLTGVNPTPPVIWIDLGASRWYPLGGRVKFIDLTWYAEYKPTVDGILGAFLWLWFLWRLFQTAPGIVSGASGLFGQPDSHPDASFHGSSMISGQRFLGSGNGLKRNE